MSPDELGQPPSALRSQADVDAAMLWSLQHALHTRARQLTWLDPDFSAWNLDSQQLLDGLTSWLRLPQRRLVLLAKRFEAIERQHPRFVSWRRDWAHAIDAYTPSEGTEARLPHLWIDDRQLCLQVFETSPWRGRLSLDDRAVTQWRDEIDALLQQCERAFPIRTLGL